MKMRFCLVVGVLQREDEWLLWSFGLYSLQLHLVFPFLGFSLGYHGNYYLQLGEVSSWFLALRFLLPQHLLLSLCDRESHDGCGFTCSKLLDGSCYWSWSHCKKPLFLFSSHKIIKFIKDINLVWISMLCFGKGIIMMTSGFFRLLPDLPKIFWRYPVSYISYGSWAIQVSEESKMFQEHIKKMFSGY